jgi:predicted heme/steroid binding protein
VSDQVPAAPASAPRARAQKKEVPRFTAAELEQHDGVDGRNAYVAYKGFVFDVTASPLWRKGRHVNEHSAGRDLTAEMSAAPHADDVMARFPIVGVLVADEAAQEPKQLTVYEPPPFVALFLKNHFHPVSVHYPIAFGLFAAVLTLPAMFMRGTALGTTLETVAWWMVLISALFTPPAALTGLWSWSYNYGGKLNAIYRWKLGLTLTLCVVAAATVSLRWLAPADIASGGAAYWAYSLLVLAHAPLVLGLGWFGGKITFPDK